MVAVIQGAAGQAGGMSLLLSAITMLLSVQTASRTRLSNQRTAPCHDQCRRTSMRSGGTPSTSIAIISGTNATMTAIKLHLYSAGMATQSYRPINKPWNRSPNASPIQAR